MPSKASPATRPWPITETPPKKSSASPLVKRRDDGLFEGFDNLESQPTVYDVRKDMGKEAAQQLRSKVAAFSSSAERASDELKPRWLSGPLKPNALAHPLSKSGQAFADRPWQKHSGSVLLMPRGSNDSPRSGSPAPPRSSSPRAGALVAANAELGKQLEREAATRSAAAAPAPTAAAAVTPAGKPSKRYEPPPPTLPKSPLPPYEGGESRAMVWDPEQRCLRRWLLRRPMCIHDLEPDSALASRQRLAHAGHQKSTRAQARTSIRSRHAVAPTMCSGATRNGHRDPCGLHGCWRHSGPGPG